MYFKRHYLATCLGFFSTYVHMYQISILYTKQSRLFRGIIFEHLPHIFDYLFFVSLFLEVLAIMYIFLHL